MKRVTDAAAVKLRELEDGDIAVFFAQQLDAEANRMAAFTRKNPADRAVFDAHWAKIRADRTITTRTILAGQQVAGYISRFKRDGEPEITYWIGKEYWGQGIATLALAGFLQIVADRPLHARVAKDNAASLRVLQKNGFKITGEDRGFANARNEEIDEFLLELR